MLDDLLDDVIEVFERQMMDDIFLFSQMDMEELLVYEEFLVLIELVEDVLVEDSNEYDDSLLNVVYDEVESFELE